MARRAKLERNLGELTPREAMSVEAKENQLISLAIDLAEERLRNGTASSSEVVHFLRLGTTKTLLEKEKLEEENKLLRAKTEALESAKKSEEMFEEAIRAMKLYSGSASETEVEDDDYY